MKTRSGFVSNSSSSSFILYGVYSPDMDKFAEAAYEHIGKEAAAKEGWEDLEAFRCAMLDDPQWFTESLDVPVELMYYDEYYAGVSLYVDRDTLLKGSHTEGELAEIDAFLAKCSKDTPSVHEGDYYC